MACFITWIILFKTLLFYIYQCAFNTEIMKSIKFESNWFWCSSLVIRTVVWFHVPKIFCKVKGFLQLIIEWIKKSLEQKWSIKYNVAKDLQRLKTKQKWRAKEAKSKSIPKSEYGDLRCNFTSTIHYQHETLELPLIIKPMGLLKVDLLTSWYYIINQKSLKKSQHVKLVTWSNVIG